MMGLVQVNPLAPCPAAHATIKTLARNTDKTQAGSIAAGARPSRNTCTMPTLGLASSRAPGRLKGTAD
jgi:hypothetical protein